MRTFFKSGKLAYLLSIIFVSIFFAFTSRFISNTFAGSEDGIESEIIPSSSEHFVTVYDQGSKKIIKTNAETVQSVLERLEISLDATDSVSPSLETPIDADNFFINIYRSRPVLIIDGSISKIVNVSSLDPRTVARSAGFILFDEDSVELISTDNFLETGISSAYKIIRGDGQTITVESDIDFATETIRDYTIPTGSEEVRQLGELGKRKQVFQVKTVDGIETERELISKEILRAPVNRVVAIGAAIINAKPLTAGMGRNHYTSKNLSGTYVEREETYYDLPMAGVMAYCGKSTYTIREDGVKIDDEGYILVAANLSRYPRCSVVETSLGLGKIYDTGTFASSNPEQFDIATDWTNRNGI